MMKKYLFLLLWLPALAACSPEDGEKRLAYALECAGTNRAELERVLAHYADDSLKREAARFLIENMPYNFSDMARLVSPAGEAYYPDITRFAGEEQVKRHCDSLAARGWRVSRGPKYDVKHVKADYLIRNIDLAFEVWQKPWAREVSFGDFCRYILPYRAENEEPTLLRAELMGRYTALLDSVGAKNAFEACMTVNGRLKEEIKYDETGNPLPATVEETFRSGIGTCEALAHYAVAAMRAAGIPVVVHQTTWTRMDRGHVWCAVWHNGRFHDFSPGDRQPDEYPHRLATSRYLQPAKVYRRHFAPDPARLSAGGDDGYVTWLKNPMLEDVTREAENPVYTLKIPVKADGKTEGQVYLCTYNYFDWVPVALGRREGDSCFFENVAGKNFFMVAEATGRSSLRFLSPPLLTERDGGFRFLVPEEGRRVECTVKKSRTDDSRLLRYWNVEKRRFETLPCAMETDTTRYYDNVPDPALLWYAPPRRAIGHRVGIVSDGKFFNSGNL